MYQLASEDLKTASSVITDAGNPLWLTRGAFREVAVSNGVARLTTLTDNVIASE